ncbi:hypothetical protein, partial [Treponema socranskii]|uniref:hypothetical protein n=1 Tax=Treponema socranskii TaxID=53419 RepID=UPI00360F46C2
MITQKMRTAETSREHIRSRRFRTFEKTHAPVFKNAICLAFAVLLLAIFSSCATVRPRGIR